MTNDPAVAWMRKHIFYRGVDGRTEGERVVSERKVYENDEPLYSATTVAELRAQITAYREADESMQEELGRQVSLRMAAERRVAAAEQKLAEVVEAALNFLEAADARDNEEVSTQYPDHEKRLRQYKAAREDLNAILPGPTP